MAIDDRLLVGRHVGRQPDCHRQPAGWRAQRAANRCAQRRVGLALQRGEASLGGPLPPAQHLGTPESPGSIPVDELYAPGAPVHELACPQLASIGQAGRALIDKPVIGRDSAVARRDVGSGRLRRRTGGHARWRGAQQHRPDQQGGQRRGRRPPSSQGRCASGLVAHRQVLVRPTCIE